jgi:integrase/recombinase XerD
MKAKSTNEIILVSDNEISDSLSNVSYEFSRNQVNESIWKQLAKLSVSDALEKWFSGLPPRTLINYRSGFRRLSALKLINPSLSVQQFSLVNHEAVVDEIKLAKEWSESTKQARAAAYISFTGFLQRRTQGIVRKAAANKEGVNKTFFKVRDKVKTHPLNQRQTGQFLREMEKLNPRDSLIAKLILQGGKRKSEVLSLQVEQIDFDNKRIHFDQTKTRGVIKKTIINYPEHIIAELREFIGEREGTVFVTRNEKPVSPTQIDRNFSAAGRNAGIAFKVTPHVLRVTLVTRLKELKVQDTDIMKITGHANPAQLSSYDKSDLFDNASLYHHFV